MTLAQEAELCARLDGRFCRSTVEIRAHIQMAFDLTYSHSGCIKLLARLGFEYRKPKGLPRVASADKQAAFIESIVKCGVIMQPFRFRTMVSVPDTIARTWRAGFHRRLWFRLPYILRCSPTVLLQS
ncbi:helix-turn-helix domain-containing protein [Yoonia sp.]|uniref:helix-turn-helix domain-containing protein n=1 Tax=Yoonia sp. TaxID=2212373 RepID=UPI003A4E592A